MADSIRVDVYAATQLAKRMSAYSNEIKQYMTAFVKDFVDCQSEWKDEKCQDFVNQLNVILSDANGAVDIFKDYSDRLMTKIDELRS